MDNILCAVTICAFEGVATRDSGSVEDKDVRSDKSADCDRVQYSSGNKERAESIDIPKDLYIPPDALEVFLETFEGPLDLLLYLIKKQNLDILNIPMALISAQYIEYISLNKQRFELAAEYLVMAAMLIEIKSRMLLPKDPTLIEEEEDPRAELVRRLLEYEQYKKAAEQLDERPRQERDFFNVNRKINETELAIERPLANVSLEALMSALSDVLVRVKNQASHHVQRESLTVSDRITKILAHLQTVSSSHSMQFHLFFTFHEGRMGVVVTFMAMLELVKQSMIELIQGGPFEPIHIRKL